MPKRDICINYQLDIRPNDTIVVPGCEPATNFTSPTMNLFMDCGRGFVYLDEAMAAIPGSYTKEIYGSAIHNGKRQRLFVMPAFCPGCGEDQCDPYPDSFSML